MHAETVKLGQYSEHNKSRDFQRCAKFPVDTFAEFQEAFSFLGCMFLKFCQYHNNYIT